MSKKSREDLPWRIASLVLATILWLFVINTQNPTQPQEIKNIPIIIKGLDELEAQGFILKNEEEIRNQNFKVVIKGPRLETDKLYNDTSLITATLNLNQYMNELDQDSIKTIANYTINILLDGNSLSVTDRKPEVTNIILERESAVTKEVTYEVADNITNKYTLLDVPSLNPRTVEIKGAKSDIGRIGSVKVHIDAADFSENQLVKSLPVKVYDIDGNEITGLHISPEAVEVKLLIGMQKTVPLVLDVNGNVPEGSILAGTSIKPQNVTIVGRESLINNIAEIRLDPIDVSNIDETKTVNVGMILPDGVTTVGSSQVAVTIDIEKENTYIYNIPTDALKIEVSNLADNLSYNINSTDIQISLLATANEIANYSSSQIANMFTVLVDLQGYGVGEHSVPFKIVSTGEIKLVTDTGYINLTIVENEISPEPIPEEEVKEPEEEIIVPEETEQ